MNHSPGQVIAICDDEWTAHKSDCSAFVRAVATRLGVTLNGLANDIVDQIREPPWQALKDGVAASHAAGEGKFVAGGLKGGDEQAPSEHGHVVVVVAGPLAHDAYPTAYWGKLGGSGCKKTTVNWAWRAADRDHVHYACRIV